MLSFFFSLLPKSRTNTPIDEPTDSLMLLPRNAHGTDYIATDPHGSLQLVQQLIQLLKSPHDRLFFCGDIIDRGQESLKVIRTLSKAKTNGKNIYCIRGNHEDMALNVLESLVLFSAFDSINNHNQSDFPELSAMFPSLWLSDRQFLKLIKDLLTEWKRAAKKYHYSISPQQHLTSIAKWICQSIEIEKFISRDEKELLKEFWGNSLQLVSNGGGWIFNLSLQDCLLTKSFIEHLPYMIRVADEFDMVHAAPLSESAIQAASERGHFTPEEITYMTWARPMPCREEDIRMTINERSARSPLTYSGHNSLLGHRDVYQNINVVNLDTATFFTECMLVVNHTLGQIMVIGENAAAMSNFTNTKQYDNITNALKTLLEKNQEIKGEMTANGSLKRQARRYTKGDSVLASTSDGMKEFTWDNHLEFRPDDLKSFFEVVRQHNNSSVNDDAEITSEKTTDADLTYTQKISASFFSFITPEMLNQRKNHLKEVSKRPIYSQD